MGATPSKKSIRVRDRRAADTLVDPRKRRYLEPFLDRALTLQEAADALGVRANTMLYQVRRLRALGLLEVVGHVTRGGRPGGLYRASAERFFVPFESTSAETLGALLLHAETVNLEEMIAHRMRALSRQADAWGIEVSTAPGGGARLRLEPAPGQPQGEGDGAPISCARYLSVRLGREEAAEMLRRLEELVAFAEAADGSGEGRFLVSSSLVEVDTGRASEERSA